MATFKKYDGSKKILVTGAAGFIGFHLSKRILEEGGEVIGFDNLNDYYEVSLKESRLEILNKYVSKIYGGISSLYFFCATLSE